MVFKEELKRKIQEGNADKDLFGIMRMKKEFTHDVEQLIAAIVSLSQENKELREKLNEQDT